MTGAVLSIATLAIGTVLVAAALRRLLLTGSAMFAYRTAPATAARPRVWVACACRNEDRRLARLLESLAALDYPADRLRILLVDDASEDGTAALMREAQAKDPERIRITLLSGSQNGKADSLHAAVASAQVLPDDLLFVVDVDQALAPDAVTRVVGYFTAPEVLAVAIRHPVRAPERSLVSAYCFLEAAVTEEVTSRGQSGLGLPTKLAGSWACRASAFSRLYPRGWQLVDDTVFTAAIIADGGHIPYASDVSALQDVPQTLRGYATQHLRWSAGFTGTARDAIRSNARVGSLLQSFDAFATYAGYFERPLLVLLALLTTLDLAFAWGSSLAPLVLTGVILLYGLALSSQILVALRHCAAGPRLALMVVASLVMVAVDAVVTIRGTRLGLAERRVGWTTDHRG